MNHILQTSALLLYILAICSFGQASYNVIVPKGETITIKVPAACMDLKKATPKTSDSFQPNEVSLSQGCNYQIINAASAVKRNPQKYLSQFAFNYERISAEKAEMDKFLADSLKTVTSNVSSRQNATQSLNDALGQLHAITRLLSIAQGMDSIQIDTTALPQLDSLQKQEVFIMLVSEATQTALWMADSSFAGKINTERPKSCKRCAVLEIARILRLAADCQ